MLTIYNAIESIEDGWVVVKQEELAFGKRKPVTIWTMLTQPDTFHNTLIKLVDYLESVGTNNDDDDTTRADNSDNGQGEVDQHTS